MQIDGAVVAITGASGGIGELWLSHVGEDISITLLESYGGSHG